MAQTAKEESAIASRQGETRGPTAAPWNGWSGTETPPRQASPSAATIDGQSVVNAARAVGSSRIIAIFGVVFRAPAMAGRSSAV